MFCAREGIRGRTQRTTFYERRIGPWQTRFLRPSVDIAGHIDATAIRGPRSRRLSTLQGLPRRPMVVLAIAYPWAATAPVKVDASSRAYCWKLSSKVAEEVDRLRGRVSHKYPNRRVLWVLRHNRLRETCPSQIKLADLNVCSASYEGVGIQLPPFTRIILFRPSIDQYSTSTPGERGPLSSAISSALGLAVSMTSNVWRSMICTVLSMMVVT